MKGSVPSLQRARHSLLHRFLCFVLIPCWQPCTGSGRGLIVCSSCLVGLSQQPRERSIIRIYPVKEQLRHSSSLLQLPCVWATLGRNETWDPGRKFTSLSSNKQTGNSTACGCSWWPCLDVWGKGGGLRLTSEQKQWTWGLMCCRALWEVCDWDYAGPQQTGRLVLCKHCLTTHTVWPMYKKPLWIKSWE